MILIADSGSTKTDWVLWNEEEHSSSNHQSKGLNPFFVDSFEISETLHSTFTLLELKSIEKIFFYGSGCSSVESKKTVSDGLQMACPRAQIEVQHDLLAAARALCGREEGVACILGTGSNACLYSGKKIVEEGVSFGFIMGDEGSGNHLGRLLLKAIFTKKAPENILQSFNATYHHLTLHKLLEHLYKLPSPNRFLATFSPFIKAHQNDPFIRELIEQSFQDFIDYFILDYLKDHNYIVHFQGSIAWNYKNSLISVLKKNNIDCGNIIHHPIHQLLEYHQMNEILK